jgi:rhodanese-related sulfurtransferase
MAWSAAVPIVKTPAVSPDVDPPAVAPGGLWESIDRRSEDMRFSMVGSMPRGVARLICGWLAAVVLIVPGWLANAADAPSVLQTTLAEANQKTAEVSTDELVRILRDQTALVLDARPHMEFATSHIPGALNIAPKPGVPMSQYVSDVAEIKRLLPDTATPLVLYCNGPFCGKSKRLGEELLAAGYSNVRRYQLGAPMWRTLIGVMQIELDGVRYVRELDRTAWFVDARTPDEFQAATLAGARNIPLSQVAAAKDDGRLPMDDHNTRVIVFGADAAQARAVTAELAKNAFHNVAFFSGTLEELVAATGETLVAGR